MTRISGLLVAGLAAIALAACGEKPKDPPAPELGPDTAQAGPMLVIDFDESQGDLGPTGFYADPPAADVAAKAGVFLRSEALPADMGLEQAGKAERFVYVTTNGLNSDNLALVGGAVFLPKGENVDHAGIAMAVRDRTNRAAIFIYRDIHYLSFHHTRPCAAATVANSFDYDVNGDGTAPQFLRAGVKADQITHEHGRNKIHAVQRYSDK